MVKSAIDKQDRVHCKEDYDSFYTQSDFKHFGWVDAVFIKSLVQRFQLRGVRLLDLGCGTGWYSYLFALQGVHICGVDLSEVGVRRAKNRNASGSFLVGDGFALPFSIGAFNAVFLSGFSPFNAPDLSTLTELGYSVFSLLKPGGLLFFHKTTNLSGSGGSRMNHTMHTFEQYFLELEVGPILGCFAVSPVSWGLTGSWALSPAATKMTRFITKLTGIPLRVLIVVRKTGFQDECTKYAHSN